jgi:hypothetical protein
MDREWPGPSDIWQEQTHWWPWQASASWRSIVSADMAGENSVFTLISSYQ